MLITDLMEAKQRRDVLRDALVTTLRTVDGLSEELRALLIADERMTEEFRLALNEYQQEQTP